MLKEIVQIVQSMSVVIASGVAVYISVPQASRPVPVPAGWLALDGLQPAVEIENTLASHCTRDHPAQVPPLQAAA
jgi:hypothetical protein